jgi:N-acetylglucosamine-6-phosphate deacetylase
MVRHVHQRVGTDLATAVRMASLTPAEILGLQQDFGSLEPGKRADIVVFNPRIEIQRVFVAGEPVSL